MSLEISKSTTLKSIIFSKNIFKKKYWSIWFVRNLNKLKDPFIIYNIFQKFKKINKRVYKLKDPLSNKILYFPTYPQRQTALSDLYYRKYFFEGVSEIVNNLNCKYILDVGANVGMYARAYSIFGKDIEIISIEPNLLNISFLAKNINDLTNIFIFHMGLSNKFGRFDTKLPKYASTRIRERKFMTGLLTAVGNENKKGSRFMRGDKFLEFLNLNPNEVGWIKIDVEGFEKNVVEGFSNLMNKINAVFEIEMNSNTMKISGFSAMELIDYMKIYKYYPYVESRFIDGIKMAKRESFDIYFSKSNAIKIFPRKLNLVKLPINYVEIWHNNLVHKY